MYFEQDSGDPDRNLSSGRVDRYYQEDRDNPSVLADSHYDSGEYTSSENQDGSFDVGYTGEWIMEWRIPLNPEDKYNMYVDKYPAQLGFSIMNEAASPEGIFPPYANKSEPKTWGTMTIADRKKP